MRLNVALSRVFLLSSAAFISSSPLQAQLVVSNLDQANNGGAGTVGSDKWAAQEFETGSTDSTLGTVGLKLAHDTSALGTFNVSLWTATAGGIPGTQIASISSGSVSSLSTLFN